MDPKHAALKSLLKMAHDQMKAGSPDSPMAPAAEDPVEAEDQESGPEEKPEGLAEIHAFLMKSPKPSVRGPGLPPAKSGHAFGKQKGKK